MSYRIVLFVFRLSLLFLPLLISSIRCKHSICFHFDVFNTNTMSQYTIAVLTRIYRRRRCKSPYWQCMIMVRLKFNTILNGWWAIHEILEHTHSTQGIRMDYGRAEENVWKCFYMDVCVSKPYGKASKEQAFMETWRASYYLSTFNLTNFHYYLEMSN